MVVARVVQWLAVAVVGATIVAGCGAAQQSTSDAPSPDVPAGQAELVAEGQQLYQATCAACHGPDLRGTDDGPPFLDEVYAPDHHPDGAFHAAAQLGVQPHHWEFGAMPPQDVTESQVTAIIAYVRAVQRTEGIAP